MAAVPAALGWVGLCSQVSQVHPGMGSALHSAEDHSCDALKQALCGQRSSSRISIMLQEEDLVLRRVVLKIDWVLKFNMLCRLFYLMG